MEHRLESSEGYLSALVLVVRPWQWYKQSMVLLAIIFSGQLLNRNAQVETLMVVTGFCFLAGGVYVFNDIADLEEDRKHPRKQHRPIASGQLPVPMAVLYGFALLITALFLGYLTNAFVLAVFVLYLAQNILYSLWLQSIIYTDVITIAVGFVFRALAGAYAIDPTVAIPSPWLIVCTLLAALMIAIGKRRVEVAHSDSNSVRRRLKEYRASVLDQALTMVSAALLMAYSLYTFFGTDRMMMLTIPFAIFALFRYLRFVHIGEDERVEQLLVADKSMLVNFGLWAMTTLTILYVLPGKGVI